jgi:hypothetical protein
MPKQEVSYFLGKDSLREPSVFLFPYYWRKTTVGISNTVSGLAYLKDHCPSRTGGVFTGGEVAV